MITMFFRIPHQHPCFPDHFPGQPIVPGALLLQWIFARVRHHYKNHTIVSVRSMKFQEPLRPGDSCRLELDSDSVSKRLNIACCRNSKLVCKGVLELAPSERVTRDQRL